MAGPARTKPVARLLTVAVWSYLLVISAVGTKLPWYLIPLFPLCAIAWGLVAGLLIDGLERRSSRLAPTAARLTWLVVAAALVTGTSALNASRVNAQFSAITASEGYRYALFIRGPMRAIPSHDILVIHPGIEPGSAYSAVMNFYARGLEMLGIKALVQLPGASIASGTFDVIACGETRLVFLAANPDTRAVLEDGDCGLYRR